MSFIYPSIRNHISPTFVSSNTAGSGGKYGTLFPSMPGVLVHLHLALGAGTPLAGLKSAYNYKSSVISVVVCRYKVEVVHDSQAGSSSVTMYVVMDLYDSARYQLMLRHLNTTAFCPPTNSLELIVTGKTLYHHALISTHIGLISNCSDDDRNLSAPFIERARLCQLCTPSSVVTTCSYLTEFSNESTPERRMVTLATSIASALAVLICATAVYIRYRRGAFHQRKS